jgi:hypothetical protein
VIFHICCIYRYVASEPVVVLELFSVETLTAVDTGADLSVVPEYVFKKLKNIKLVKADKILY